MKELVNRFSIYFTRVFFYDCEKDFIDFIVILTFPIWGLFIGISILIIQLVNNAIGGIKNGKK